VNLLIPHGFEANYTLGFARGLAANRVAFVVVSSDETARRFDEAGIAHCNLRGSQDSRRSAFRKSANLARYYLLLLWTIFRHRGQTIHFSGLLNRRMILLEGVLIPLWIRLWAGRYIHTAHNAVPHGREESRFFRRAYRWVYRFPDVIIAHSRHVAGQLESAFNVDPGRISVISIGLNEEAAGADLSRSEARRQTGLPPEKPVALFFGKVENYKGVDLLIEAWSLLKTAAARLVIAGMCPDGGYAASIRNAIARSPRAAAIEWREVFVPNQLVPVLFKACDVAVMPYRAISQSGVLFLCLRLGVPIVATNVGSMAEFIDDRSGILAKAGTPTGIAEALDTFFENRARFQSDEISRRAAKYGWEQQCHAIRHWYF